MSSVNRELACQFCTFINEIGTKICNACGRSLGLPVVNLSPSGIECPRCTFQNPYGAVSCGICTTPIVKDDMDETMSDMSLTMDLDAGKLCQICYSLMTEEFNMPGCTHTFCKSCAKQHFSIKIMECGINTARCPVDVCVSFDELPNKSEFFRQLKTVLFTILDAKTRKVFADKISILEIMDKPGFVRCPQCNHGFITKSKNKKSCCPECLHFFCTKCNKNWVNGHLQTNCKPNGSGMDVDENGDMQMHCNATCPQCKYNYFLERGGCMHITCSQCSYEYCEFCFKKITGKGKNCDFPNCSKGQSLHGHHPRNCMYYVKEMEHTQLEKLLKSNGVRYSVVQKQRAAACNVKVNVENDGIWVDSECGAPATKSHNNMCMNHYKWHLGELMKKNNVDPVNVMNNLECFCELKRNNVAVANNANYSQPIEDHDTIGLRILVKTTIPYEPILQ